MNGMPSTRAEALFLDLVEADAAARRERLDKECADDAPLRAEVESLLAHHDGAGVRFLDTNKIRLMAAHGNEHSLEPESRIGGYRILGTLGQGGMGIVYRAQQERPRRIVALKVIRRASASPSLLRRFEHEAEMLGRLQHPGIAQIYEAGRADTGQGPQPFIAMELIQGRSLTEYGRERGLGWRERMSLVAQVCDAVQHAHQRGIIHRDLKPSNILVNESGQPKVLDFGVARSDDADALTLHTGIGELVGTLPYMSPEQVGGRSDEIDTRTDVYSLGVVLYELLAERLPHDLSGLSLPEAARKVREDDPARLSTTNKVLRGDVETVVSKALERDRSRRYQTAAEFGADIRRCITGEPIQAKADSAMYVLRKQLRRYRGVVIGAGVSVAALAVFTALLYSKSTSNARLAESERLQAARANILLHEVTEAERKARAELTASRIEQGRLFARAGNLRAAEGLIWSEHARDPEDPYTAWALAETYTRNPCVRAFRAHNNPARAALTTPDGRTLITAAEDDPVVRFWSLPDGVSTGEIDTGSAQINAMALDAPGLRLALVRRDGAAEVWNTQTFRRVFTACTGDASSESVTFTPDGRYLLCGTRAGSIVMLSATDGSRLAGLQVGRVNVNGLVYSHDGSRLAVWTPERIGRLWNGVTLEPVHVLRGHNDWIHSAAFSPDGSVLATGSADRSVRLWDVDTGAPLSRLLSPNGTVNTLRWLEDGSLLSCGWHSIDRWYPWPVHGGPALREAWISQSEQTKVFACGGRGEYGATVRADGRVHIWRLRGAERITEYGGGSERSAAAISPSGRVVAVSDQAGVLRLYEANRGELLAAIPAHKGRSRYVQFQPGGRLLATGGTDRYLRLWDMTTGSLVREWNDFHNISGSSGCFSPDGSLIASCGPGYRFRVRRVDSGAEVATTEPMRDEAISVHFSPDGRTLATIRRDVAVELRRTDTLELVSRSLLRAQPWATQFSPDGTRLFVSGWHDDVFVLDVPSLSIERALVGHFALVPSLACVETGDPRLPLLLASSSSDGDVRLWDWRSGRCLATFQPAPGWEAICVAMDNAGRRLVSAHSDGGAVSWDLSALKRGIAGNVPPEPERWLPGVSPAEGSTLLQWASRALREPLIEPPIDMYDPEVIRSWGRLTPGAPSGSGPPTAPAEIDGG